jgi:hypothetical protein
LGCCIWPASRSLHNRSLRSKKIVPASGARESCAQHHSRRINQPVPRRSREMTVLWSNFWSNFFTDSSKTIPALLPLNIA